MNEIERFLSYIFEPGEIVELRTCVGGEWNSGHFSDLAMMATSASSYENCATGVYYTLNPLLRSAPCARKLNGSQVSRVSAHNWDIRERRVYLIDVDPVRPSGTASTDAEKAEALSVSERVRAYLTSLGWPEPIRVDSGNGYHMLYRGEPGTPPKSDTWPFLLKALAENFDTPNAHIDISVHNPARVSRLPGTFNRKGTATEERPHRMAQVLSYPDGSPSLKL